MRAKLIIEEFDMAGWWTPNKKDPFEKAREYSQRKDLKIELSNIVDRYKNDIKGEEILQILKDILKNKNIE